MGPAHPTRYLACMVLGVACATAAVHPPVGRQVALLAQRVEAATSTRAQRPAPAAHAVTPCRYA